MTDRKNKKNTTAPIEARIKEKLYVKNEYGYEHQRPEFPTLADDELKYLNSIGKMKTTYNYSDTVEVPLHPMCVACQARHLLKYKNAPVPFDIACKGVPDRLPPQASAKIRDYATNTNSSRERAQQVVASAFDPVAWAELIFGFNDNDPEWSLRWYQKQQLRCSSQRYVIREGRRSGKSFIMALKLLYLAFTMSVPKGLDSEGRTISSGPQIIVAAPFQAQLTNIFDEMEKLVKRNVDLVAKIESKHGGSLYIKSPFYSMRLDNGATINGFVTGVEIRQDGSAGGSIRGQSANVIYVDEMDMIPEDILDKVIVPILFTSPNTMFFATSTPIGKAGKFHSLCTERPDFKEDYLPSTVLPHWSSVKKELDYTDVNDDSFIAEYMAHFIESASGVFKAGYVYDAMKDYSYESTDLDNTEFWQLFAKVRSRSDLITIIGIDWNKNAGSEFVTICYDPKSNWWWLAEAVNVSPSQFNSVRFKEEVIRLNYKWKPDYIYADEGYGHHIIDDLKWEAQRLMMLRNSKDPTVRITSLDEQTMQLLQRLKKFNFSQKVELANPIDGTTIERTGKEFLVENAIRVFESGRISFSASDVTLRQQLLNYIVLRRHASNGRPVYGMKAERIGDHRLDALMLALGGLFLEKHPIYSQNARMGQSSPLLLTKQALDARAETIDDLVTKDLPGYRLNIKRDKLHESSSNEIRSRAEGFVTAGTAPHSVLSTLRNAPSYNGYENDTREKYEARRNPYSQAKIVPRNNRITHRTRRGLV